MGSAAGVRKAAARRLGITLAEYEAHLASDEKWCTACKEWHSQSEFGSDPNRSDGLAAVCYDSRATGNGPSKHERRAREAEGLAWCSECGEWLEDVAQGKCREHRNSAARAWYAVQSDEWRRRKMAIQRGPEPVPEWWREKAFAQFEQRCAYGCGRPSIVFDHIWPVSRGGRSLPGNLAPACTSCNSSKNDGDPEAWLERGLSSFPDQWLDLIAMAIHNNCDEWAGVL